MKLSLVKISRFRPDKNVIALVMSIILASLGVFYAKEYIEKEVQNYRSQFVVSESMTELVVPKRRLERGDRILAEDLSVREIPSKYADSNSVRSSTYESALGQRLSSAVDEGRPLLWAHLESGLTQTFSGRVPTGLRAITVRVDEINSISGFLQPLDRIDLLLSYRNQSSSRVVPLIQNLEVFATGLQTLVDKSGGVGTRAFSTITVKVSPAEAQRITLAQEVGKLTAMLRNPDDEALLSGQPLSANQLLNTSISVEPKPKKKKSVAMDLRTRRIEYIIGGS